MSSPASPLLGPALRSPAYTPRGVRPPLSAWIIMAGIAGLAARSLFAQDGGEASRGRELPGGAKALEIRAETPFEVGEVLTYRVSYAFLDAGTLRLAVDGMEDVAGRRAYHLTFKAQTNPAISAIYSLKNLLESWMDAQRMHSLRFVKESVEKGKRRDKRYRLDQARGVRINEESGEERPMPADAQDDVSIFYFLRTLPLKEGVQFTLNNLMDPDDNPMRVRVLGTDRLKVPAGTFDCFVLDLDVHTDSGIFSQGSEVKAWITKDARRVPVKLESKLALGAFTAALETYEPGAATPVAARVPAAAH